MNHVNRRVMCVGTLASAVIPTRGMAMEKSVAADELAVERRKFIEEANQEAVARVSSRFKHTPPKPGEPPPPAPGMAPMAALIPFGDWDFYYVRNGSIDWWPEPVPAQLKPGELPGPIQVEVRVPEGFVTDFASIPRIFWSIKKPEGRHAYAAVVHDYLYWTQRKTRLEADDIFRQAMIDSKVDQTTVTAFYQAVRTFGGSAWEANAKMKAAGERRFLKTYPPSFTTSWNEWKTNVSAFYENDL